MPSRTITIPSGSVAEDLYGFPLFVRIDAGTNAVTWTQDGNPRGWEEVSYADGKLTGFVKADISASADTELVVTY